jgi:outer membrane receptor protein involved in Fe transport
MKKFLPTVLLSFLFSLLRGQASHSTVTLKGTITDSTNGKGLSFATLALQNAKTQKTVKNYVTKDDGSFEISVSDSAEWQLVIAFAGFTNKTITISKSSADLGKIPLKPADKELNAVTVTAVKPVIKRDLDGISYDVASDPETPSLSALDMMRKVPLLSVDANDNVKLKGKDNYKILINGKESALMAKNPSDVLRAMPATNIERIEVITTPPAKYDAEGLAGIINIITKKKIDQGYNIGLNGRLNTIWGPGFNLNGTYKSGKFGVSGYVGYGIRHDQTNDLGSDQILYSDKSTRSQTGFNSQRGRFVWGNIELSYEIDTLNLLTGSFQFFNGQFDQRGNQSSNAYDSNGILGQSYQLGTNLNNNFGGMDASINYQKGFAKNKNQLLTFSYKYSYSPNTNNINNTISDTLNYYLPSYKQYNHAGNREQTIQADYVQPFKLFNLEAGAKAILRDNFSNFTSSTFNDSTKDYIINPAQTNDFTYNQDIYSAYNSYSGKWGKWNAKLGLRLEHTTINADFMSTQTKVTQDYNNFIPSVSVQYTLKGSSISLGYTDRISRPGIYQLNPFVDFSNPNYVNTGNPNLQPETNHTFELNYNLFSKNSLSLGLSYAFSNNSIQNVTHLEALTNGGITDTITVTTFENLGSNKNLGINMNLNISSIKNLSISLNAQLSHIWLKGSYNGQFYTNDGSTGNAFLNLGYKFGKDNHFRVGFDAGYFSGDVFLQGYSSYYIFNSYSFAYTFWNKRITLSAVANNPYQQFWTFRTTTTAPDFYQSNYNQIFYRNFALRFNIKVGKLNADIKKNQRGINNDDTKGGKGNNANP